MRVLIIAAVLAAGPAIAQDDAYLKGKALQDEVKKLCKDGCVVINRERAQKLNEFIAQAQEIAYMTGLAEGQASCSRKDI